MQQSPTAYAYDADGNLTSAGTSTYAYNGAGELTQAVTLAGTYTYDAAGNLSADSKSGALQQTTVWDLNGPLPQAAEQTGPTGTTTADFIDNPNGTLEAMTSSGATYHATTDWLGSVTGLISSSGTQVTSTTYSPYGSATTTGTPASPLGFAGSYTLPGSGGLDDMRARDYSPATGGFTRVDPLLAVSGQPYAYADGSPSSLTDPSGEIIPQEAAPPSPSTRSCRSECAERHESVRGHGRARRNPATRLANHHRSERR